MRYKNVVWDWNGTLLDDVRASLGTINRMLEKRALKTLTLEQYRELFGFPVRAYYESIGFDFNRFDWEETSLDFVRTYDDFAGGTELTIGVKEVLKGLQQRGINQYILSALQEHLLEEMLVKFDIRHHFKGVCGSDNIYAAGKVERGRQMLEKYPLTPSETLMIGDTLHDAEVAEALGFDYLLYTGGHNSEQRLRQKGAVIGRMEELLLPVTSF